MAIALVPLAGLMGGGIDMSRMYITKTRLQHACDAGALAGRKAMGGGIWTQSNGMPNATAVRFFDANFPASGYGTRNLTKSFTESAGKVSGTASVELQMTLVKVVTKDWAFATLSVNCDAEMRLPNTDVMFVLDNTGSMDCDSNGNSCGSAGSSSKMAGLKVAVKCFYEIVARLDTDADCTTGTPSGGTGTQVQIRFGFVPYATNVNVGKLLPSNWFADNWTYQSRQQSSLYGRWNSWDGTTTRNAGSYSGWSDTTSYISANNSSTCSNNLAVPADSYTIVGNTASGGSNESDTQFKAYAGTTQSNYQRVYNSSTKICMIQVRTRSIERRAWYDRTTVNASGAVAVPAWLYKPVSINLSPLKNGTGWNDSISLPIGDNFISKTVNWDGCIEERATVRQSSYDPIPSGARDLDIDGVPSSWDASSLWAPALGDAVYPRRTTYINNSSTPYSQNPITTFTNYTGESYSCSAEARKLQTWDASNFDNYVDQMVASGNTYHDIGLIWGARFLSPTGLFASQNALTPSGGEIQRHMIFMTDGDPCTSVSNYQAYGLAWFDRRQTDASTAPTDGCTTTGTLTQQVNARTVALCTAIKNKNITLWVVSFGYVDPNTVTRLTNCASSGKYFSASNSAALQTAFASIANQISQLRLTK
ncbi:pilus assembly protein TadG-related protein [Sphingomonas sp. QA11]|uniref:pilus assembly protein TadG-related protein n=1 Tax=Sphingomonas sp. QA11 TaxID=2950605 RepID=UPI00234A9205|nr:pilus assembly protein TadG-related protein [Sphingomonas sp. QA11]WCM28730.1 pilus assembly protein TadG-related protein [Sphingomonas sp. QA11]